MKRQIVLIAAAILAASCSKQVKDEETAKPLLEIELSEVAEMISSLPITPEQMREVHDAVSSSSDNGYDEEYTLSRLFSSPGSGVGENFLPEETKAPLGEYQVPMKSLIKDYLSSRFVTKAGLADDEQVEDYIESLTNSDMQIYWPYSESWDGEQRPTVTFNPGGESETNIGWVIKEDGTVEETIVDEEYARNRPVWVINNNEDAEYRTTEILRRQGVDIENGGMIGLLGASKSASTTAKTESRALILQKFYACRNYDSWFAGASEFWLKIGGLSNFTAATEAEMRLYSPSVTDVMIVVKRNQVEEWITLNCMLMSDITNQVETLAFVAVEDDGGSIQNWNCEALVKVNSKSYGVTITIPINSRDDIVWRGSLSYDYLLKMNNISSRFGDVKMIFYLK